MFPRRERAIQTENARTTDVGIQCRRDSEEWYLPEERTKDTGSEASDSKEFLTYVSENTFKFGQHLAGAPRPHDRALWTWCSVLSLWSACGPQETIEASQSELSRSGAQEVINAL